MSDNSNRPIFADNNVCMDDDNYTNVGHRRSDVQICKHGTGSGCRKAPSSTQKPRAVTDRNLGVTQLTSRPHGSLRFVQR